MHAHPLEARMAHVEGAFNQVDRRLDGLERRFDSFVEQMDRRFNWLTGIVVGSWLTMMATQITTILAILYHR